MRLFFSLLCLLAVGVACEKPPAPSKHTSPLQNPVNSKVNDMLQEQQPKPSSPTVAVEDSKYKKLRSNMVDRQIIARGVENEKVIAALLKVPRHLLVPGEQVPFAYEDCPLPIGHNQTISQPYIVAFMTEVLNLKGKEKILEIGTGSGYQAAVLAEIVAEVYTIEIVEPLATKATQCLKDLGYANVHVKYGDGYQGWAEHAPFDAVIVTCAPNHIPAPLQKQLKIGGRMIIPVGDALWGQELVYLEKTGEDSLVTKKVLPVRFVPMTGQAQNK